MNKKLILPITAALIFSLSSASIAKKKAEKSDEDPTDKLRYPIGCTQMGYTFDLYNVIFTPTAKFHPQTLYFVHNISNRPVTMLQTRTGTEQFVIYNNTTIAPNRWSALAMDEKSSKYICSDSKGNETRVPIQCKKVLDICEFASSRFGTNHRGNYWLPYNNTMGGAKRQAERHGILLYDPKRKI